MDSIRTCSPAAQSSKTAPLSGTGDPGMSETSVLFVTMFVNMLPTKTSTVNDFTDTLRKTNM